MKTIIVYYSKTGFTKRYAEWLQQEMGCDCIPWEEVSERNLSEYDTVVFASWFHAGKIKKIEWWKKQDLKSRRGIVLATGAMPAGSREAKRQIQANVPNGQESCPVFYLPGGLCYEKMSFQDKLMMKAFVSMIKKKKDKTQEEKMMAEKISESYDLSKKEYLEPVLEYMKGRDGAGQS